MFSSKVTSTITPKIALREEKSLFWHSARLLSTPGSEVVLGVIPPPL